jgi:hypothetical protein
MKKEKLLLQSSVEEISGGRCSLEKCVAKYPCLADNLRADANVNNPGIVPSPEFRNRARLKLQQAMADPEPTETRIPALLEWCISHRVSHRFIFLALVLMIVINPNLAYIEKNENLFFGLMLYFQNEPSFAMLVRRTLAQSSAVLGRSAESI